MIRASLSPAAVVVQLFTLALHLDTTTVALEITRKSKTSLVIISYRQTTAHAHYYFHKYRMFSGAFAGSVATAETTSVVSEFSDPLSDISDAVANHSFPLLIPHC